MGARQATKRREFITFIGGAVASPLMARAQQKERVRRIGVLMGWAERPVCTISFHGFFRRLGQLGWADDRNLRIDLRWAAGGAGRTQQFARELIALQN